jgi:uncharacterized ferritin-like protein (DUF455 family)
MKMSSFANHVETLFALGKSLERIRDLSSLAVISCAATEHKVTAAHALCSSQEALNVLRERLHELLVPPITQPEPSNDQPPQLSFAQTLDHVFGLLEQASICDLAASSRRTVQDIRYRLEPLRDLAGFSLEVTGNRPECPLLPSRDRSLRIEDDFAVPEKDRTVSIQLHKQIFNIEVCAAEICAMIIYRFQPLPNLLELNLARQCWEEACHAEVLLRALEAEGGKVGEIPVSLDVWKAARAESSAAECIGMEMAIGEGFSIGADLFHVARYQKQGRPDLAELHQSIHIDETNHARSGLTWFRRLAGDEHADLLKKLEARSSVVPLSGEFFFPELRAVIGFTDVEIERQRRRAVDPIWW